MGNFLLKMHVTPRISNSLKQFLQDRNKLRQAQLLVPKLLYLVDQIFKKCVQNSTQGGTLVFKLKNFENNVSLNLKIVVPKVSSC